MSDTQKMDDFFLETRTLVDQLGEIALALPEELISIMVLNAMPKLYKGFVQSLISRDEFLPLGNIETKLKSEEIRLKSDTPDPIDEALLTNLYKTRHSSYKSGERPRFSSNFRGRNNRGHQKRTQDFEGRFREPNRHRDGKCDNCGQARHWERECPLKSIAEQIRKLKLRRRDLRKAKAHSVYDLEND